MQYTFAGYTYELSADGRSLIKAAKKGGKGKKVIPKIGGKRPGKKCGKTYIAADRKCKGHYSESGKLTDEGKASAQELAGKVRQRKGLSPIDKVSRIGDTKGVQSSTGLPMKVEIKGGNLPTALVGSKSFKFHKGSTGQAVKHPDLDGWKVESTGNHKFFDIKKAEREKILNGVADWLKDKTTRTVDIDHDWKQARDNNLEGLGVKKRSLEYEMYNPKGRYYG